MVFQWLIAVATALTIQSGTASENCAPSRLRELETTLVESQYRYDAAQVTLDSLENEMTQLSRDIETERSRSGSIGGRRRLEKLLGASRSLAQEMTLVNNDMRLSQQSRDACARALFDCYRAARIDALQQLTMAIRDRDREAMSETLTRVQQVEGRLEDLPGDVPFLDRTVPEPLTMEIRTPDSPEDQRFFGDALIDLRERAVRDSTDTHDRLLSTRKALELKLELRNLMSDASLTGLDGRGFFDRLGSVDSEIEKLRIEVGEYTRQLLSLRRAAEFYARQEQLHESSNLKVESKQ